MNLKNLSLALLFSALVLPACGIFGDGDDDDGDDGGGSGGGGDANDDEIDGAEVLDARATCDDTASAWDDLFTFEVETNDLVNTVRVEAWVGNTYVGSARVEHWSGNTWYSEVWADDLGADCDDWYAMYFEITATGAGSSDVVSIEP